MKSYLVVNVVESGTSITVQQADSVKQAIVKDAYDTLKDCISYDKDLSEDGSTVAVYELANSKNLLTDIVK